MSKKTLVAYFSCTGTTKKVAELIGEMVGADLFEIKPEKPYTAADLDWKDSNSRSSVEMKDKSSRPKIANSINNMDDYNMIYLGFPIWWYVAPTIINTFLESYDFTGKTIVLFATSGGSGFGNTVSELESSCKGKIVEGKLLNGVVCKEEVKRLIDKHNI